MPDVVVREGRPDDAAAIARVHVRAWQAGYAGLLPDDVLAALDLDERRAAWEQRLRDTDETTVLVAERRGEIIGFVACGPSRDEDTASDSEGEVYALYVDPDGWRHGVGRALLAAAVERLAARWPVVRLWVLADNARGRRFYEAVGFVPDGSSRAYRRPGVTVDEVRYGRRVGIIRTNRL